MSVYGGFKPPPLVKFVNSQKESFTIGRNNYLFCESVNGGKASAIIYSIIETAKANGPNVYKYYEFLITELYKCKKENTLDHIDGLLPWAKTPQKECKAPVK